MKLRALAAIPLVPVLAALSGCGMPANPQPPSLKLPQPVKDLTAIRVGNQVHLHWTMTKRTTDKITLTTDQNVHICREPAGQICQTAGALRAQPGKPAEFTDSLPAAEATGNPALLTYYVELRNPAGRSAGPSNPAWTASGAAPASVEGITAKTVPEGVLLSWQPAPGPPDTTIRIHRLLVGAPAGKSSSPNLAAEVPIPAEQTLVVRGNVSQALDNHAPFNQTYRYTVERVRGLDLAGHPMEIASTPSAPVAISARDIYPPAVPTGLEAVADVQGHAIDLSWTPNTEPDVAGYIVYRGEATQPPIRIAGKAAVETPAYRDMTALPGVTYTYSVSAIDRDGNESARSTGTSEALPR